MDSLKKILLIDGDQQFGDTLRTTIAPENYELVYASTCVSGIEKMLEQPPDLILYNTNLEPSNGSEVFKALRSTASFRHIPVVFYKDKEDKKIQYLLNNNGNWEGEKSKNHHKFLHLPDHSLEGSRNRADGLVYDFNTLFHLVPNGLFICDKNGILSVNQVLMNLLKRNEHDFSSVGMEELFDKPSLKAIRQWIKKYTKGDIVPFSSPVVVKDRSGMNITMSLTISELKKEGSSVHFLGLLQAPQGNNLIVNYQLANEVCNLLKRENMCISEALEKKITQAIKQRIIGDTYQKKSFFTRRENEVLRLSMEGLSIKIIADKLSLSTRTVEKYRTKLMLKTGAKNIVEVIVFSLKNNLVKI